MRNGVCVVGAGSWGTVIASLLARKGHSASLLCRDEEIANSINENGFNPTYSSAASLLPGVQATVNCEEALRSASTVYLVVPSQYMRAEIERQAEAWTAWANSVGTDGVICNCTKGLMAGPVQRTDEWLSGRFPGLAVVHLSGPNLASEIVNGLPAAAVAAAAPSEKAQAAAERVQSQLASSIFRVYTGQDPVGVEAAGFYKNIIAIAAGVASGLGLGANAHALLLTRGLAEMGRLVQHLGGLQSTLLGLAGVGDLVATCSSTLSRNFQTGLKLAEGKPIPFSPGRSDQVAEGVQTSLALHNWRHELSGAGSPLALDWPELPIAEQVYRIVHEGARPRQALDDLMSRPLRAE